MNGIYFKDEFEKFKMPSSSVGSIFAGIIIGSVLGYIMKPYEIQYNIVMAILLMAMITRYIISRNDK